MVCAPSTTAFMPLAQTLFTNVQGTLLGMPAFSAACVAGACSQHQEPRQSKAILRVCVVPGSITCGRLDTCMKQTSQTYEH